MSGIDILAMLAVCSAIFGLANYHILKFPRTIALLIMGLCASLVIIGLEAAFPAIDLLGRIRGMLERLDFADILLHGMLAFLLFAGAINIEWRQMSSLKWPILILATVGTIVSTFVIGIAAWAIFGWLGLPIPLTYALVFGALISPTDPVAVLGVLKTVRVPKALELKIAGESLFNDGAAVVLFGILASLLLHTPPEPEALALEVLKLIVVEIGGGVVIGTLAGLLAARAIRSVDNAELMLLLTLALVTGVSALCDRLDASAPLAVVLAGLIVGNAALHRVRANLRQEVHTFWSLLDELLNALLFLIIGMEVLLITFDPGWAIAALLAIPLVLAARWVAIAAPIRALSYAYAFTPGTIGLLTWGGLRGGVSIALALSLPDGPAADFLRTVTYVVVVFSVVVQGLTIKPLVRWITAIEPADAHRHPAAAPPPERERDAS